MMSKPIRILICRVIVGDASLVMLIDGLGLFCRVIAMAMKNGEGEDGEGDEKSAYSCIIHFQK